MWSSCQLAKNTPSLAKACATACPKCPVIPVMANVDIIIIYSFRFTQGTTLNEKVLCSLFLSIITVRSPITTTNHGEESK